MWKMRNVAKGHECGVGIVARAGYQGKEENRKEERRRNFADGK